jgi:tetratricopeptide (TPR) repeat protein
MKRVLVFILLLLVTSLALAANMELTSARLYKKQGEWLKSIQFYTESLKKDPAQLDAYFERGEMYMEIASDPARADLAKQLAPDAADPRVEMYKRMLADFDSAKTARTSKDEGAAKKNAKKISDNLQMQWVHFYAAAVGSDTMATIYTKAGQADSAQFAYNQALKALDLALLIDPARWNTYGFKAQIYGKLDSTNLSATYWQQTVDRILVQQQNKNNSDATKQELADGLAIARENLLVDCYNLGRRDCVMAQADAILALEPTNINAIQLKANSLAQMATDTTRTAEQRNQLKQEAIQALEKARDSQTGKGGDSTVLADILYTIGQFNLQLGDTAKAIEAMNQSLAAKPNDTDALFLIGVMYLEGGRFVNTEKARDTFKKIVDFDPENRPALTNYGVALIRLGQTDEGRKQIEKAKALGGK